MHTHAHVQVCAFYLRLISSVSHTLKYTSTLILTNMYAQIYMRTYRCAHILLKGKVIGVMGIIHPQTLQVSISLSLAHTHTHTHAHTHTHTHTHTREPSCLEHPFVYMCVYVGIRTHPPTHTHTHTRTHTHTHTYTRMSCLSYARISMTSDVTDMMWHIWMNHVSIMHITYVTSSFPQVTSHIFNESSHTYDWFMSLLCE